mgnify:CR=1 FL=1
MEVQNAVAVAVVFVVVVAEGMEMRGVLHAAADAPVVAVVAADKYWTKENGSFETVLAAVVFAFVGCSIVSSTLIADDDDVVVVKNVVDFEFDFATAIFG